ncbi:hypothetical protein [Salmonella enterica]
MKKELSDIQEDNDSLIKSYLLDKGHVWYMLKSISFLYMTFMFS